MGQELNVLAETIWNVTVVIAASAILIVVVLLGVVGVLWAANLAVNRIVSALKLTHDIVKFGQEHREWKSFKKIKAAKRVLDQFDQQRFDESFFQRKKNP